MRLNDIYLRGLGVYLPERVSTATAIAQGLLDAEQAAASGLTGAACAGDTPAPEMALWAARQAVERAAVDPAGMDVLLYADNYHSGPDGWFPLRLACVYFDHPQHTPAEHTLNIDFLNPGQGPSARVAVELSEASALALADAIHAALGAANVKGLS